MGLRVGQTKIERFTDRIHQRWIARPTETPAASITASDIVGCGCIASMISLSVASS
jgi:hypothetical protein